MEGGVCALMAGVRSAADTKRTAKNQPIRAGRSVLFIKRMNLSIAAFGGAVETGVNCPKGTWFLDGRWRSWRKCAFSLEKSIHIPSGGQEPAESLPSMLAV